MWVKHRVIERPIIINNHLILTTLDIEIKFFVTDQMQRGQMQSRC